MNRNRKGNNWNRTPQKKKKSKVSKEPDLHSLITARFPKDLMGSACFPASQTRKMLFHTRKLLQGAVPFIVQDFEVNNVFSPDTVNSCTGFAQMAAIYGQYVCLKVKFRYNVANNENALPVYFGCIARDVQPSTTITTWAQATDSLELAPTTGPQLVGETSGQAIFRSRWYTIDPAAVVGNKLSYYSDVDYTALTSSAPTRLVWVSFILTADLATTNLTNGAFLDFYLELTTEFFSLKNLAS